MRRTLLAFALAVSCAAATWAQDMVGVSWTGDVYRVDSTSGTGSLIAASGAMSLNAMARRSDGRLYAAGGPGGTTTDIYEIDPASGAATSVLSVPLGSIRALAFGPSDELYAINNPVAPQYGIVDLHRIDLAGGTTTLVGATGYEGIQGMAWGVDTLYGYEIGSGSGVGIGLIMISPTTAVCTDVDPTTPGNGLDIQCLAFDDKGTLYGANDELFTVDLSTGVHTLVGGGGYDDLRGIEFAPTAGPTVYCTAKPTSIAGCLPSISGPAATASISAGSGSFDVTCGPLPGGPNFPGGASFGNVGVLTYSTNGPLSPPLQNTFGWQCIQTGPGYVVLKPIQLSGGTLGTCSGSFAFDFGARLASGADPALIAGAQVDMQIFYRDPLNIGEANLSDAMSFVLVP